MAIAIRISRRLVGRRGSSAILLVCVVLACSAAARGQVERGYLGADVVSLTSERAARLELPNEDGVEIKSVEIGSPAAKAGIQEHDVILRFDDRPVYDTHQLNLYLSQTLRGTVKLSIKRNGNVAVLPVAIFPHSISLATEAQEKAEEFFEKAFSRCTSQDDPELTGLDLIGPFPEGTIACGFHPTGCEVVIALHTKTPSALHTKTPSRISAQAENLSDFAKESGYQWLGAIVLDYDSTRTRYRINDTWQPWDNPIGTISDSPFRGRVAVLAKRNGRWFAVDVRAYSLMLSSGSLANPLDILKLGPQEETIIELLSGTQSTTLTQLLVNAEQPSCKDIFKYGATIGPRNARQRDRGDQIFVGTPDGFSAAFPKILRQATDTLGIDDRDYSQESAYIIRTAKLCSQITPEMIRTVTQPNVRTTHIVVDQLGSQYDVCDSTILVSQTLNALDKERDLGIELTMNYVWNSDSPEEAGPHLTVGFYYLKSQRFISDIKISGIAGARLYPSAKIASQLVSVRPLKDLPNRRFDGSFDEFSATLPGLVQQAATALSLDPNSFQNETAMILQGVKKCMQITPQLAQKNLHHGLPDVETLPSEYDLCKHGIHDVSKLVKTYDVDTQRGLTVSMYSLIHWGDGKGVRVAIDFTNLKNEKYLSEYYFDSVGIVIAEVH